MSNITDKSQRYKHFQTLLTELARLHVQAMMLANSAYPAASQAAICTTHSSSCCMSQLNQDPHLVGV
jgi:hypothetical protein